MKTERRKTVVFTILVRTLLNIVAVALTFALIIMAWEKYDWLPIVKNIIRGVLIPILLGCLLVFLLRHKVGALKDKWKPFVMFVIFLTGTLVFVNAGIIAREACSKVVKVDSITTLSNEEIKRADYLQIESVEPDTSSCNYLFDDAVIHSRGSDYIRFLLYQVCPLKNGKGVFLCTRTKETHPYGTISENRLQQWKTDFVNREESPKNMRSSDIIQICVTHFCIIGEKVLVATDLFFLKGSLSVTLSELLRGVYKCILTLF